MKTRQRHRAFPGAAVAAGFSMVEATLAVVVVAVMFVAALSTLSASRLSQKLLNERAVARQLAAQLVAEIQTLPYHDPDGAAVVGLEGTEALSPGRTGYDDVDDYTDFFEHPIHDRQGNALDVPDVWVRSVEVEWIDAADLKTVVAAESGFRRVVVRVQDAERELARASFIATAAE